MKSFWKVNNKIQSFCLCLCLFLVPISAQVNKQEPRIGKDHSPRLSNKVEQIDTLVRSYADAKLFNGSVLVAQNGKVIFRKGYGLANMEWNIPNSADTKFRIGSVTKQFTAMLIMQLRQGGKLDLQGKITDYLPWYRKDTGNRITVHHLLTHTSGIPNYTQSAITITDINTHNYSPKEIAEKYCSGNLEFEPGSQFKYNNSGYFLLGVIVEAITGKPYSEALKEMIFRPVGMKNSGIDTPSSLIANRAAGYEYGFDGYINTDYINMESSTYSAGAIYSTVDDIYLWHQALFGNRLLSKENTAVMLTPNLSNYGYGVYISRSKIPGSEKESTAIGHPGGIHGFSALSIRFMEDDISVILLDNTRVGKRGNLENTGAGIHAILNGRTPDKPQQTVQLTMIEKLRSGSTGDELVEFYRQLKNDQKHSNVVGSSESFLNNLGYFLLGKGRIKDSLAVLKLAVEEYPISSNTFDTYAEALMKDGQKELATKNYKRSLELDPKNTNAIERLKMLQTRQ